MLDEPISVRTGHEMPPRLYLLYHQLTSISSPYSYAIETSRFKAQVELSAKLRESQSNLRLEFTFDDGYLSDCECASPILDVHNFRAHFFITVGWTSNKPGYMGWDELETLRDAGHTIGAHGWSHRLLTHCRPDELDRELRQSRFALEDRLGIPVATMSLPGGRYDRQVLTACRQAGYTSIYTSAPRIHTIAEEPLIGRLNVSSRITLERMERLVRLDGRELAGMRRRHQIVAAAKWILGDRLYHGLWAAVVGKEMEREGMIPSASSADHQ